MEYANEVSAISLAAKLEDHHSKAPTNSDIWMYAGAAVASLGVFAW